MDCRSCIHFNQNCAYQEVKISMEHCINHNEFEDVLEIDCFDYEYKCEHKNIIASHYANEETQMYVACRVRCKDCHEVLFETKGKEKELTYQYIEKNKDNFDTLDDRTCDDLNNRLGIKEWVYYEDINL